MKNEKPILFSGEMVRAILDGRKTQTRRVIKNRKDWNIQNDDTFGKVWGKSVLMDSPFGSVGGRLWVREKHKVRGLCSGCYEYACDCSHFEVTYAADNKIKVFGDWDSESDFPSTENWRPSLFLPRFLSRITLEIKNVRVERLQDISEADAVAEGMTPEFGEPGQRYSLTPKEKFYQLWSKINGAESWEANPWVWVVEFERVK